LFFTNPFLLLPKKTGAAYTNSVSGKAKEGERTAELARIVGAMLSPEILTPTRSERTSCFHCGSSCPDDRFYFEQKAFCCQGCRTVYELLQENGLTEFYALSQSSGVRVKASPSDRFNFLDAEPVRSQLVDFSDEQITRVAFYIPSIHCIACVWLLERLYQLQPGVSESQVNFPRKEVRITFDPARVSLSKVVGLLASMGYEPELKLSDLEEPRGRSTNRSLLLQLAVAGFAFGNLMLLALGVYFGVDAFSGPTFRKLAGYFGLLLTIPVFGYSASYYWRTAWFSIKQRRLAIEVPIAVGILAIFGQSAFEVLSGRGEGYFDSLSGLLFFLLCGRLFQEKTFQRLSFHRDYQAFFPLSVTRLDRAGTGGEEQVSLKQLRKGDHVLIRNGELIPADARLTGGQATIDYSFVSGESEPVTKTEGDHLFAGGRQTGGAIEVEIIKPVSQSYLTSLWNQEAFRKEKHSSFETLINQFSYRFSVIVISIALGAALFWWFKDPSVALKAFISVLIVACPCALALAAPFTLGTAIRTLGKKEVFVKGAEVIEAMATINTVVFDKTGTLTAPGAQCVEFVGSPLSAAEGEGLYSLVRNSTHPLSVRIAELFAAKGSFTSVRSFREFTGQGIQGLVEGREIQLGSLEWLKSSGIAGWDEQTISQPGSAVGEGVSQSCSAVVHVAIERRYRGAFLFGNAPRADVMNSVARLKRGYDLALLSGDSERQKALFTDLFGEKAWFQQSPWEKLEQVVRLQKSGAKVMMVGDGLNDAGALRQSDVGIAVVEHIHAFSPASDVIVPARSLPLLPEVLQFSRAAVKIVRLSFLLSSLYNVVGIAIAATGLLSPVVCAVLMPLSSASVVIFAAGSTSLVGRRIFSGRSNVVASVTSGGERTAAASATLLQA
jgi:Cu+-exporting ATPase